jgi:hypothetical protein
LRILVTGASLSNLLLLNHIILLFLFNFPVKLGVKKVDDREMKLELEEAKAVGERKTSKI